jgi:5-methylcytosine-specific restriction endonuclease McrA
MRISKTPSEALLSAALAASQVSQPEPTGRRAVIKAAIEGSRRSSAILGSCGICGQPVFKEFKHPHRFSASVDHKIPLARGGTNALGNLQLAHLGCNSSKGAKLPGESPPARALRARFSR